MSKRPDLGAMALPKTAAAETVPFSAQAPVASAPIAASAAEPALAARSLTIKLDGSLYAALRNYCHTEEGKRGGKRVTHQEVMVDALKRLLDSAQ